MSDETETRDRILDAARTAFLRHGTSGARTQEIADAADVNKALLHYYFRTKDRLAEAVFTREARRLLPPVLETLGSEMPLDDKVRRVVELYLEVLPEAPGLPAYVMAEMHYHPERLPAFVESLTGATPQAHGTRVRRQLDAQIAAEVEAGRIRPIATEQFMANLISLCIFPFAARPMLQLMMGHREGDFEAFVEDRRERLADFFLRSLRP